MGKLAFWQGNRTPFCSMTRHFQHFRTKKVSRDLVSRGFDVELQSPLLLLTPSKSGFLDRNLSINGGSDWLWLGIHPRNPSKWASCARFAGENANVPHPGKNHVLLSDSFRIPACNGQPRIRRMMRKPLCNFEHRKFRLEITCLLAC